MEKVMEFEELQRVWNLCCSLSAISQLNSWKVGNIGWIPGKNILEQKDETQQT